MTLHPLEIIILILCFFALGAVIIFFKRKSLPSNHYEVLINNLNLQKEKDLKELEKGNKEINKLEQEILICKKQLHMKLFEK